MTPVMHKNTQRRLVNVFCFPLQAQNGQCRNAQFARPAAAGAMFFQTQSGNGSSENFLDHETWPGMTPVMHKNAQRRLVNVFCFPLQAQNGQCRNAQFARPAAAGAMFFQTQSGNGSSENFLDHETWPGMTPVMHKNTFLKKTFVGFPRVTVDQFQCSYKGYLQCDWVAEILHDDVSSYV